MSKDLEILISDTLIPIRKTTLISLMPVIFHLETVDPLPTNELKLRVNGAPMNSAIFHRVSERSLTVTLPYLKITHPINTLELLTTSKALGLHNAVLGYDSSEGVDKIVQQIAKVLYSTEGTDIFTEIGLGLIDLPTQRLADIGYITSKLKTQLPRIIAIYNESRTSADPPIVSIDIHDVSWVESQGAFTMTLQVTLASHPAVRFSIFSLGES